jgi:O-antigen/teichoic acid export membrane protein
MTEPQSNAAAPDSGLARAAITVAGTRVTLLVIGTVVSVVVARSLGPNGRGEYAFVIAVAAVAIAVAHLSVGQAQVYLASIGRDVRSLASNAVPVALGLGLLAIVVVIGSSLLVGYPSKAPFSNPSLLFGLAAVPPSILVLYTNGLLVLAGRIKALNRSALFAGLLQCLLLGLLAFLHELTVATVVLVWTVNACLPLVLSLPVLKPRWASWSWSVAREELTIGLRYHTGMSSLYLLLRIDVLLLAGLRSDREVGLYSLAVALIELTNVATDAVATVVTRRQTNLAMADAAALTARVVGLSVILAAVVSTALALASPLLIPVVYGDVFRGAVPALIALVPGVLALAATRAAGGYLIRLNRPGIVTLLTAGALIVNVACNLALIPRFGIVGAGLASSLAYIILAAAYLGWMYKAANLTLTQFMPHQMLSTAARMLTARLRRGRLN